MVRLGNTLKVCARVLAWAAGCLFAVGILWFAANRLLDARPDPRRDAFLGHGAEVPDEDNMAIGAAGLSAPSGTDFMAFGAGIKKLYERLAPWPEIRKRIAGPDALGVTVSSEQLNCWIDPTYTPNHKECPLPIESASQALATNKEILGRYKSLYGLGHNVSFGDWPAQNLISVTKLAIVEIRLDMRKRNYESAFAKWRDHFRFTRTYLRGQSNWVDKAIGMVDFGFSFGVIEDLLVEHPSLATTHFEELLELLRPEGISMLNPAGLTRAEYLSAERYLRTPYVPIPEYEDTLDWLAWNLGQKNRVLNRYLSFYIDLPTVLRKPWGELPEELSKTIDRHEALGFDVAIDPFGYLMFVKSIHWQRRPSTYIRQIYISDGRLRLATLVVRMVRSKVKDAEIPAFLANAGPELYDPFAGEPMRWDAKNGRIYFVADDDKCYALPFRVPVWDSRGGRPAPKVGDWQVC